MRPAPRCALVRTFLHQREGRSLRRHFKMIKRGADNDLENEDKGKLVAGVAVGSVTIPIFFSPTRVKVSSSASPPDVPAMARGKPNIRPMRAARTGFAISPRRTLATSFRRSDKCPSRITSISCGRRSCRQRDPSAACGSFGQQAEQLGLHVSPGLLRIVFGADAEELIHVGAETTVGQVGLQDPDELRAPG